MGAYSRSLLFHQTCPKGPKGTGGGLQRGRLMMAPHSIVAEVDEVVVVVVCVAASMLLLLLTLLLLLLLLLLLPIAIGPSKRKKWENA